MKEMFMYDDRSSKHRSAVSPEGARRATEGETAGGDRQELVVAPDPEVPARKRRRRHTAGYKLRILDEADQCSLPGQIGALLRREGLYSSSLIRWRRQREQGILAAMGPKKRGRKHKERSPLADEVSKLQKENEQLRKKLWKAERIIEVQKKISEILGISQDPEDLERSDS
jgi:transposase-like protein